MPRRVVTRCTRRGAADTIGQLDELLLRSGHAFGVATWEAAMQSRADYLRLWRRWADEITDRWIDAYPGSRPMAMYVLGELPAPAWRHELPALRQPVVLAGRVVIEDRGWHGQDIEVEHLASIGQLDDDEHDRAVERLESDDPLGHRRYRPLADGSPKFHDTAFREE